jgi:hypothetical protein
VGIILCDANNEGRRRSNCNSWAQLVSFGDLMLNTASDRRYDKKCSFIIKTENRSKYCKYRKYCK